MSSVEALEQLVGRTGIRKLRDGYEVSTVEVRAYSQVLLFLECHQLLGRVIKLEIRQVVFDKELDLAWLPRLQSLDLEHVFGSGTLSMTTVLKKLRRVKLASIDWLIHLAPNFGECTQLRELTFERLGNLQSAPGKLCRLPRLTAVRLAHCRRLRMAIEDWAMAPLLTRFEVISCDSLIPGAQWPVRLRSVAVSHLDMFPPLSMLLTASSRVQVLTLPQVQPLMDPVISQSALARITHLTVTRFHCTDIAAANALFGLLRALSSFNGHTCTLPRIPPQLSLLPDLTVLALRAWTELTVLDSGDGLYPSLLQLELQLCPKLDRVSITASAFPVLTDVKLSHCSSLTKSSLDAFSTMASLRTLRIVACGLLAGLPVAFFGSGLRTLEVKDCAALLSLAGSLPYWLNVLEVESCPVLFDVGFLPADLMSVKLTRCPNLARVAFTTAQYSRLAKLVIRGANQLVSLSLRRQQAPLLHVCAINECDRLVTAHIIAGWTVSESHFQFMNFIESRKCSAVMQDLPKLQQCPELLVPENTGMPTSIFVVRCSSLPSMDPSWFAYQAVQTIEVMGCENLTELPPAIGNLAGLRALRIFHCGLASLPGTVYQCASLTELLINHCRTFKALPDGTGLPSLERLTVGSCPQFAGLPPGLAQHPTLRVLNIEHCDAFSRLPYGFGPPGLTHLSFYGCTRLQRLPFSLGRCSLLNVLNLALCRQLAGLPPTLLQCAQLGTVVIAPTTQLLPLLANPSTGIMTVDHVPLLAPCDPRKVLLCILAARRRRMRHLPAELWHLVYFEFVLLHDNDSAFF